MYILIWLEFTIYIDKMYTKLHVNVFFLHVYVDLIEVNNLYR